MTKDITTTERVIGFAKEFIGCILDDHGYELVRFQNEDGETRYAIEDKKHGIFLIGEGHELLDLDEVVTWIDRELYDRD